MGGSGLQIGNGMDEPAAYRALGFDLAQALIGKSFVAVKIPIFSLITIVEIRGVGSLRPGDDVGPSVS